jgi:hypothetical protein
MVWGVAVRWGLGFWVLLLVLALRLALLLVTVLLQPSFQII